MSSNKTEEIFKGIYWVGGSKEEDALHCNPYLIIDEEEAVLVDPGSVLDFEYVFENVCKLVPLEKIKYVILHHQDPDFCASVPLFEKKGANFKIVTHWRTQTLVKYYGVKSDYYIVNENALKLVLKSGRILKFVPTPYLHFPGSIATYDTSSKILFSSDLFGALSFKWSLYAGDDYIEKMKTFHEHYMPSNDIIRPVMEVFLKMDISMIAPQHGSIIKDKVQEHIKALRELECGAFMEPIKKDILKFGGYRYVCNLVLKRYLTIFKKEEILEVLEDLDITIDSDNMEVIDYNYRAIAFWNILFEQILAKKGLSWLLLIEPLVVKLSKEYDIPVPEVLKTALIKSQGEAENHKKENEQLKEINVRLRKNIKETQHELIRCPITGLYNFEFFKNYLAINIKDIVVENYEQNPALTIINIDNVSKIKFSFGDDEVDDLLKNTAYIINSLEEESIVIFRLQGASFACYMPHTTKAKAVEFAEKARNAISSSEKFIVKVTVSIGVVCFDEIDKQLPEPDKTIYNTALLRVKLAKDMGMNIVCSNSSVKDYQDDMGKILIVDTDEINIDILKTFLGNLKYKLFIARDGEEALDICERESPNLIISEVMLPKFDGFIIRERLLAQSDTKNIPFILVSHLKSDDSVQHAAALNIEHYFKKPYMLSEMIGVIKNKTKGDVYK